MKSCDFNLEFHRLHWEFSSCTKEILQPFLGDPLNTLQIPCFKSPVFAGYVLYTLPLMYPQSK